MATRRSSPRAPSPPMARSWRSTLRRPWVRMKGAGKTRAPRSTRLRPNPHLHPHPSSSPVLLTPSFCSPHPQLLTRTPHPARRTPHPAPRTPHPATLAFPSPQVVRDCKLPHGGHAKFTCLYEKDTVALPRLVEQGKRIQFCFIDGLHTFDYTMLDAFYADQVGPNPLPSPPYPSTHSHPHPHLYTPTLTLTLTLNSTLALTLLLPPPPSPQMLDVGGVLAFDDIGYPPVQKATLPF